MICCLPVSAPFICDSPACSGDMQGTVPITIPGILNTLAVSGSIMLESRNTFARPPPWSTTKLFRRHLRSDTRISLVHPWHLRSAAGRRRRLLYVAFPDHGRRPLWRLRPASAQPPIYPTQTFQHLQFEELKNVVVSVRSRASAGSFRRVNMNVSGLARPDFGPGNQRAARE